MPGFPAGQHYDYSVDGINLALFSSVTWRLLPTVRVEAGLRGERQHYDYDNRMLDGATAADGTPCLRTGVVIPCRYSRPADRDDTFTDYSLDLGTVWQIAGNHSLSARWAHGFRPPQASELYRLQAGQTRAQLDSEEAESIEAGWRGHWENLQTHVALYRMDKKNIIFQDDQRRNVAGADSRHYGLEYSARWQFAERWSIEGNGTWARHRFASNERLQGLSPAADIAGNDMVAAPRTLASVRLSRESERWGSWELEWSHLGRYYLEPTDTYSYPGHDLFNLRWDRPLSPSLQLAVRLLNVTNRDYAERADYAFGNYRYFVGEPRSAYIELRWAFLP
jgi:outer membrane receptor protein involved in Fe transport